jgi:5-methylcytosine-specific restriction endonuclease McrA
VEYKRLNRAHCTALETVRRGRKAGAAGWATPVQIAARVAYYGGRCWMCGAPWEQIDHVKPLRVGGPNWPANLRPACGPCNGRKNGIWPYPTKARVAA